MLGTDYGSPRWMRLKGDRTVSVERLEKVRGSGPTEVQALKSVSLVFAAGESGWHHSALYALRDIRVWRT